MPDHNLKAQVRAGFHPEAPGEDVAASLACRHCLRAADLVLVVDGNHGINAFCRCATCDTQTVVGLTPAQLLRLREDPPEGIRLDIIP